MRPLYQKINRYSTASVSENEYNFFLYHENWLTLFGFFNPLWTNATNNSCFTSLRPTDHTNYHLKASCCGSSAQSNFVSAVSNFRVCYFLLPRWQWVVAYVDPSNKWVYNLATHCDSTYILVRIHQYWCKDRFYNHYGFRYSKANFGP